jgi:hypothetical protein
MASLAWPVCDLILSVLAIFLKGVSDRIRREGRKTFDQRRYEADFDAIMERQHAQTPGNLLKRVSGLAALPAHLQTLVVEAKAKRDVLAHHYFRSKLNSSPVVAGATG